MPYTRLLYACRGLIKELILYGKGFVFKTVKEPVS